MNIHLATYVKDFKAARIYASLHENIKKMFSSFSLQGFVFFSEYFWCSFPNLFLLCFVCIYFCHCSLNVPSFIFRLFSGVVPRVTWISIGGAIFLGIYDKVRMVVQDTF